MTDKPKARDASGRPPNIIRTTIDMDRGVHQALKVHAVEQGSTLSGVVQLAVEAYCREHKIKLPRKRRGE